MSLVAQVVFVKDADRPNGEAPVSEIVEQPWTRRRKSIQLK